MTSFSIITPMFNGQNTISRTIESVRNQTYSKWELIIVDDCSKDNSIDIVERYSSEDCRIKLIKLSENSGSGVARNAAIRVASGRYIAFLDSDDIWLPDKLESQLNFMQEKNANFVFSAYSKKFTNGVTELVPVPELVNYDSLLKCCVVGCLTAVYDTKFHGKVYMPEIRKRQDFGLWLKLLKQTDFAHGQDVVLAEYTVRSDSLSANKFSAALYQWRIYREVENMAFFRAVYYFSHYAVRGLLRRKFNLFTFRY